MGFESFLLNTYQNSGLFNGENHILSLETRLRICFINMCAESESIYVRIFRESEAFTSAINAMSDDLMRRYLKVEMKNLKKQKDKLRRPGRGFCKKVIKVGSTLKTLFEDMATSYRLGTSL